MNSSIDKIVREYLSRKDPRGNYVIPADKNCVDIINRFNNFIEVEEAGNTILIKTRSRRIAEKIVRILVQREYMKHG
ncbi:hypothetical protein QPL79_07050 [Ignisphaera sp. 4213-co]|uniref:Uncharacterized protein n=1 Tax=Ignisphaera cupida TaxID=3050454 RepID=A0ABD4Z703_9CREN|nr:hypothetical protein [Ignisphaera sp. 4213-co]MDK6029116.1 hypothetical protein [Ignisphaera sp. 4213-co]